ncbi:MAG: SDR family oxidoreductase [Acidimicrobiia bacterium]|nr:SDR family oxidoreductase [Acidimicrobiia bacterium]
MEALLRQQARERFGNPERWDDLLLSGPPPARPQEIADIVVFVASDRAAYLSGTVITVDGGAGYR